MKKENTVLREVTMDMEELREKVRAHKIKRMKRLAILVGVCAAVCIVGYIFSQVKTYSKYRVVDTSTRADSSATQFTIFCGNILKYSNDGAIYTDDNNTIIWNQSFEMDSPMMAKNEIYAAFADVGGQAVYVVSESGLQATIQTAMSIQNIDIAENGTVAVLMENKKTSYLALYNLKGDKLAEGGIHVENSGYPMDLALSANGENLVVSILDINTGSVKTTLSFYNFGTVGQNKVDNIVNTFSFAGSIAPRLEYIDESTLLAFFDDGVRIFKGVQTPEQTGEVLLSSEIKSIFYDDSYVGLVVQDSEVENGRRLTVYDLNGGEMMNVSLDMSYEQIYFLKNHEVCVQDENKCAIYTTRGIKKFEGQFESNIYYIIKGMGIRDYTALLEGSTQQIRCRFFSSTRFGEEDKE